MGPTPGQAAARRLHRNVGLTMFALLVLIYLGIGYNFGNLSGASGTNEQQLATLVEYLWELPAIGVPLAVVVPLLLLRPVARDFARMIDGEPLSDPEASARRILHYPKRVAWYFTPASLGAYVLGNVQSVVFTKLPWDEFWRGIPLGLPLGLLFSLAAYITLVRFLDPVRRRYVERQGYAHIPSPVASIQGKVMVTSITIVALGLALLWLIAIGSGQAMLEDQLLARMEENTVPAAVRIAATEMSSPDLQAHLSREHLGAHGYAFVIDGGGHVLTEHPGAARALADEGWTGDEQERILTGPGQFADRETAVRLVAFAPVPATDLHVVVVTFRSDFSGYIDNMTWAMAGTTVLALAIALALTYAGSRSIARPLAELTAAMRKARTPGARGRTNLMTDDEVGALAASYEHMMARLGAQTHALEESVDRLREMDEVKTRFINIASHELRTPMTPLRTELHMMRTGKRGPVSPEMDKGLQMLTRNVDRLNRLIRELLEASRMQAGHLKLQVKDLDLPAVAQAAVQTMEGEARKRGVTLVAEVADVRVRADGDRVQQVLINLMENALQFTPRGGTVRVSARATPGMAELCVEDDGAGIAAELVGKLFQPFSQAESGVPRTEGGTGLGLFICKGIVEAHGGRIHAESDGDGRGARFFFTLPLAGPPLAEDVAPEARLT
ncbi:MAG: HAMP domain-containing protein [Halobacteriales archaeon]|nr:HAMP domain-containing protein [Halobacteriales archaeon]